MSEPPRCEVLALLCQQLTDQRLSSLLEVQQALSGGSVLSSVYLLERLAVELLDLVREGSTQAGGTVRRACRASSCCQR